MKNAYDTSDMFVNSNKINLVDLKRTVKEKILQ